MPRTIGIGHQDFEQLITSNNFYIDKTHFIKEWWENNDTVTLITRPRRFGKTLNLNMAEYFFLSAIPKKAVYFKICSSGRAGNSLDKNRLCNRS